MSKPFKMLLASSLCFTPFHVKVNESGIEIDAE